MKLSNKTIVITGGNSGIGRCLLQQLHAKGNRIIIATRSQNNWQQITEQYPDVLLLQVDLSKKESVLKLTENLKQHPVELLINCAAVQYEPTLIDEAFSFDTIETEITTNFTAVVWLCHQLIPTLQQQPASAIVNLSSGLAIFPKTTSAVYCASKAAIHSLSQSLRYQLANSPIQVSEVILPLVDTPMTAGRGTGKIQPQQAASAIINGIEKGRDEIYIGKAKLLPLMVRIWPGLIKKILQKY